MNYITHIYYLGYSAKTLVHEPNGHGFDSSWIQGELEEQNALHVPLIG